MTEVQIIEFLKNGVLVVPNVLSSVQLKAANLGLKQTLLKYGVDTTDEISLQRTKKELKKLSSTNGAGGVLDLFYEEW